MTFWTSRAFRGLQTAGAGIQSVTVYGSKLKSVIGSSLESTAATGSSIGDNLMSVSKTGISLATAAGSGLKSAVGESLKIVTEATTGSSIGGSLIFVSKTGISLATAAGSGLKSVVGESLKTVTEAASYLRVGRKDNPGDEDNLLFVFDQNLKEIAENSEDNDVSTIKVVVGTRSYIEESLNAASTTGIILTVVPGESLKYATKSGLEIVTKTRHNLGESITPTKNEIVSPVSSEEILFGVSGSETCVEYVGVETEVKTSLKNITTSHLKLLGDTGYVAGMRLIAATKANMKVLTESDFKSIASAGLKIAGEAGHVAALHLQNATGIGMQAAANARTNLKSAVGAGLKYVSEVEIKTIVGASVLGTGAVVLLPLTTSAASAGAVGTAAASTVTAVNTGAVLGSVLTMPSFTAGGIATKVGLTAVGATVAVTGATVALPVLGFTSAGVAAGSAAAVVQSCIGSVTAGSVFALLQSAGAAGMALSTQATFASGGAIIAILAIL